jgi:integrase/recombinase XerD
MAISTKFILRTQSAPTNSEFPIMLQIIIDRKNQLVSTKKYSSKENWMGDEQLVSKSHPQQKMINLLLKKIASEVGIFIMTSGSNNRALTFEDIKSIVRKSTGGEKEVHTKKLLELFEETIQYLKAQNRLGYAETFTSTKKSIGNFIEDKDVKFISINTDFLRKYEDYLINRNCAITTRSVYFRTFRTLWRIAIRDGHCPETHYPFKDFAFSKYNNPRTKKRAINKEQVDKIASIIIPSNKDTFLNSRNYFLFSFYCRGLNFTDLASLKWPNIKDGEINYTRAKTKEKFNFKLHPIARQILEYYKELPGNSDAGYIFPILYKRHKTPQSIRDRKKKILKRVNKDLKELAASVGIEKTITTYVARHSYATALRQSGFSKEDIGKSLGHEDIKTTEIYLDDIGDPLLDDLINSAI